MNFHSKSNKLMFIYEVNGNKITHEHSVDIPKDELVEAFEVFMKAIGYQFRSGEHLGYEWEDDLK